MEQWIPLMVAVVGAIAAIGVAFWNTRGESVELRQLKAMNDAIAGMPTTGAETVAFAAARNELALRVAARVASAPKRRRIAWFIVLAVAVLGIIVGAIVLLTPLMSEVEWVGELASWTSLVIAVLTAVLVFFLDRVVRASETETRSAAIGE